MSYVSCPGVNEPIVKRARIGQNGLPVFFLERFAPPCSFSEYNDPSQTMPASVGRVIFSDLRVRRRFSLCVYNTTQPDPHISSARKRTR